MKGKSMLAAGVLLCLSMQLFACGREQPIGADKIYVGVAYYNQSDTFISQLIDCLKEQLRGLEAECALCEPGRPG